MNKKVYIKPQMETVELGSEVLMQAGSTNANGGSMNIIDGSFDSSEDDQYSNRNRGTWGNLWSN